MTKRRIVRLSIFASTFLVFATMAIAQVSDPAPPVLVGFDFAPRTIDISGSPQTVTLT
jgi:hypothetical protein